MNQKHTIALLCLDQMTARGPCRLGDLAEAAKDAGLTRARDPRSPTKQALSYDPRFVHLHDDVYDATANLLDGSWFTVRVRYRRPGRTQLFVDRELGPLLPLLKRGGLPLLAGGEVHYREHGPAPGLVGPPGWLPDLDSGALLGLQLRSGRLAVVPVEVDEEAVADEMAQLRELVTRHAHVIDRDHFYAGRSSLHRDADDFGTVVLSAHFEAPDLLRRPLPPLDEILQLPHEVGPAEWSRHLLDAADDGETLTLAGVPRGLLSELQRRAARMSITVSEYVVLQLGANAWRWQPPCVHEVERRRAEAEYDRWAAEQPRTEGEVLYLDRYGDPVGYTDGS